MGVRAQSGPGLRVAAALVAGGIVLSVAVVTAGRLFGAGQPVSTLETTVDGRPLTPLPEAGAYPAGAQPVGVHPGELEFLGAADDPARLALVEAGGISQPALVWFHSDWCAVCQAIKPAVVELGRAYAGQVRFVRVNVDNQANWDAVRTYQVRGTPTFIVFRGGGQPEGRVLGWPGHAGLAGVFDRLLTPQ